MPAKKETMTDEERAKRIRQTAQEAETSNDPAAFDRAFAKVVKPAPAPEKPPASQK
jgi:hypothetical protein